MILLVGCRKFDCNANALITHLGPVTSGIGPGASESLNTW